MFCFLFEAKQQARDSLGISYPKGTDSMTEEKKPVNPQFEDFAAFSRSERGSEEAFLRLQNALGTKQLQSEIDKIKAQLACPLRWAYDVAADRLKEYADTCVEHNLIEREACLLAAKVLRRSGPSIW